MYIIYAYSSENSGKLRLAPRQHAVTVMHSIYLHSCMYTDVFIPLLWIIAFELLLYATTLANSGAPESR